MCQTLVEVQYPLCGHTATWEIPSPVPNCQGTLHRFERDTLKNCKHCWVAAGWRKKGWKKEGRLPGPAGTYYVHCNFQQVLYGIQDPSLENTAECPMWKRRWPWNTRLWAQRRLFLMRDAVTYENARWQQAGEPDDFPTFVAFDEDTKDFEVLEVISVADLKKAIEEDRKKGPAERKNLTNVCNICYSPFYDANQEEGEENCSGGGEIIRRVKCGNGQHLFGLECIISTWKFSMEDEMIEGPSCPSCRTRFYLVMFAPRRLLECVKDLQEKYYNRYRQGQRPGGNKDPRTIYFVNYFFLSCAIIGALPMYKAVNHTMNFHHAKYGGKLPFNQIVVIVLAAHVLQIAWFIAILTSPLSIPLHLLWVSRASVHERLREFTMVAVGVIRGDHRREVNKLVVQL